MVFKPLADRTRWEGVVACCWLALFDLLLVVWALRRPVDWLKFLFVFLAVISLPLLAYWAYRTWAAFTLRYTVEREGLTVEVPATEDLGLPLVEEDRRVVGHGVDLHRGDFPDIGDGVGAGAVYLRDTPESVGVLQRRFFPFRQFAGPAPIPDGRR